MRKSPIDDSGCLGQSPLVSLIIPCYNAAPYLPSLLDSILSQSYENWEAIFVDDGSEDQTVELLRPLVGERITLLTQDNRGVSSARNRGLEMAKGRYVSFVDSDDSLPCHSLADRVNYMEGHPEIGVLDGIVCIRCPEMKRDISQYIPYYKGPLLPRLLKLDDRVFFSGCYLVRRDVIKDTRFDVGLSHGEDLLFFIELAHNQEALYASIPAPVYIYRRRTDSTMANLAGLERGYLYVLRALFRFPGICMMDRLYLRIRIARIMFLSWLDRRQYCRAVASAISIVGHR